MKIERFECYTMKTARFMAGPGDHVRAFEKDGVRGYIIFNAASQLLQTDGTYK